MSFPNYPGSSFLMGSISSCPPPQDCCCTQMWEIRPGDRVPRAIEVTPWIRENLDPTVSYTLDDKMVSFSITDLTNNVKWPATPLPAVVLPLTAPTYFTVNKIVAFNVNGRAGYRIEIDVDDNAPLNARLRVDYKFKLSNGCGEDYEGNGCALVFVRKCFLGTV